MRVTNQMITRNSQARLQTGLHGIDRLREDISSGVSLRKVSDDPTAAGTVVRLNSSLRAITQYRRNIDLGLARASREDVVLDQLSNGLNRAIDLGISAANGTATAQTRLIAKAEVDQVISSAVELANTKMGDEYLFGGSRAGERPLRVPPTPADGFSALTLAGNPVNPSGAIELEIGEGAFVAPTHNATEVFLSTNALESLRALSTALGNNDVPAIQAAMDAVTAANGQVQGLLGSHGARVDAMESARLTLGSTELSLSGYRADLRDTDVESAIASLVSKQTLHQAAMSATTRILGLSLANYL